MAKKPKIQAVRKDKGLDARTADPKDRTLDSTKNHLKQKLAFKITLDEER